MNKYSKERGRILAKAAVAFLAAGVPMQYAAAAGNTAPNALIQQQGTLVQGTVTDEKGEPLIGVSVTVEGVKGAGVVTNIDGQYKLTVAN